MVVMPSAALAQSAIAGVVRDSSGAVLPGVTVEAASDALIERVRTVITDGSGQYRIVELRPGRYTVTFTLSGFNTFKREDLELPTDFVATVNADMRVGSLQETITVTGESPMVDVQSAKRQRTIDSQLIQAIPSARAYNGIVRLIPSMTGGSNDVVLSPGMIVFGSRGGRGNEGRVQVDGLNTGASLNGGGVSGYRQDLENATEVSISTSGGMGEAEVGGIAMNIIPRTGGNNFTGHVYATGFNDATQASNYTDRIKTIGLAPGNPFTLAPPNSVNYNYETSFSAGGPIKRDRMWFFGLLSYRGSGNDVSMFHNRNAGDITKWLYEADLNQQAKSDSYGPIQPNLRLTIQLSSRDKLNLFWDEQISSDSIGQGNSTNAPETGGWNHGWQRVQQVKWTSTATNKLLLEAGLGTYLSNWNTRERPGNNRDLIQVNEQCSAGCPANGGIAGLNYRGMGTWSADWIGAHTWNAAASYITGTHNMKFGYQGAFHVDNRAPGGSTLTYRFNNGIPNRFTMNIREYRSSSRVRYNAFYAQDQWTRGRLTLSGGLRYDHSWSYYPEQSIGGTRFLPAVTVFPESKGVEGYNDISPRVGAVYDLFGTGRTAIKFNTGRYLEAAVNDNGNYSELLPASRVDTSTNRTWTDNGNFNPDCDFLNPAVQDNRATGGDLCGQITEDGFGKSVPQVFYDPLIMKGWGVRPADWQIGVTVQHEILPRISVEVGYSRRWLQNFTVTDNLARAVSDHTMFSVIAPLDSRLPGGGGYAVDGIYDPNQNVATLTNNFNTYAPNYGKQYSIYNGLELSLSARLRNGVQFQAGSSTGETVTDNCEIRAKLPEISLLNPYCHNGPGITTRVTGASSYTIPRVDVLVSGTFQSSPGAVLQANWIIPNATVRQWLGRDLSNQAPNITVNLLEPGQMRGERVNQIDFRVGKLLRFGRQRATLSVDMFNLLNPDTILTYNQTYNPTGNWLNPLGVMTARTVKFTAQWDF
jgi:hypothetical protein